MVSSMLRSFGKIGPQIDQIWAWLKGGFTLFFFVKLDFEIAVDQQTKSNDQTFEGVPNSGCPPVPT